MTSWLHHPFEAISIYLIITFLFVVFDIPLEFIYWYSIIFILHVAFTHTKMYVPDHIDSWLRYLIVTPNAHRLHHSTDMKEGNSNFGQIFLFWDVLFKTHMKTSSNKIHFGIRSNETPQKSSLKYFLINPFK
jgi:sterol desaturase/sphingolipid hydroxylase (fatty acid hydroxylase superfamily)